LYESKEWVKRERERGGEEVRGEEVISNIKEDSRMIIY
jgi:hypothetical protein